MAQLGRQDEFEDRNAGVAAPEPQDAGPGFMGKIFSTFSNVKQRVSSPRTTNAQSTPSTASAVETGTQPSQESQVDDLKDSPRDVETRDVSMPPSRAAPAVPEESSPADQVNNDTVGLDTAGAGGRVGDGEESSPPDQTRSDAAGLDTAGAVGRVGDGEESSPPDQVHNDAVGLDTAGAGGRVGDGEESSPPDQIHSDAVGLDTAGAAGRVNDGEESSPPDQIHNDAVGLDTAGAGGRVGDGVETSPVGGTPQVNSRSVDTGTSQTGSAPGGTPANPTIPKKDFGERIMDKLPFTHANPYSVGNPTPTQQAGNPYTAGDQTSVPASPSAQSREPHSPGFFGKLKNLVTGQKATQGTATENATTGTAGTTAEREPLVQGYTQEPSPGSGDIFHKATGKLGGKGPDVGSAEAWPAPAKPDMSNVPSATRTDEEGRPIEGPTQPKSEDTKKEGLMTKLMDKLHLHGPNSPTAASTTTGTSPTAKSAQNTGMPTYTEHAPQSSNPEGQASGPTEI